jgi:hypothetical protein
MNEICPSSGWMPDRSVSRSRDHRRPGDRADPSVAASISEIAGVTDVPSARCSASGCRIAISCSDFAVLPEERAPIEGREQSLLGCSCTRW